jgi:hypothetical protein
MSRHAPGQRQRLLMPHAAAALPCCKPSGKRAPVHCATTAWWLPHAQNAACGPCSHAACLPTSACNLVAWCIACRGCHCPPRHVRRLQAADVVVQRTCAEAATGALGLHAQPWPARPTSIFALATLQTSSCSHTQSSAFMHMLATAAFGLLPCRLWQASSKRTA